MIFGSARYEIISPIVADVMICWNACSPFPAAINLPIGVSSRGLFFSSSSGIMPRYSEWSVTAHQSYGVAFLITSPLVLFLTSFPLQKLYASSGVLRVPKAKASGELTVCMCCSPK